MDKNVLSRILNGEANSEEKEEFYRLLSSDKKEEELFFEIKSLWIRSASRGTKFDLESEFEKLWKRINPSVRKKSSPIGIRVLQYAAVSLFILGIGGLAGYFISRNNLESIESGIQKFTASKGSVSTVEFADGTKIWLNSGSELTYREDIIHQLRLAELKGEAFFEIKHHEDFPFEVKVGQIVVHDLGTTFNIKAYPDDQMIETALFEGKADILNQAGNSMVELKPGECAVYNSENKEIIVSLFDIHILSAWREGKFVIRDQRLEDIFKEVSRWYDIEFVFENQALRDYRYTGKFKKTTTAEHVLKMLKLTTHFNYKIIDKPDQPDVIIIY